MTRINYKDLFRGLEVYKLETQVSKNPRSVLKKKGKLKVFIAEIMFLRIIGPALLVPGLVQDVYELDGPSVGIMDEMAWMSESCRGNQRIIWKSSVCLEIDGQ